MPGHSRFFRPRVLVPLAGFLLLLGLPATGPAQAPSIGALKQKRASLAAESRRALVELYGLESRLATARATLARVDARAAGLARRQESARRRYATAERTLRIAQFRLGRQLRILYQQDEPDPIAVVLGATSLDDAIDGLETISRTARATKAVVAQSGAAREIVARAKRELAIETARTSAVRDRLTATTADLQLTRVEHLVYVTNLRKQASLTDAQIASLEHRARRARDRAAEISARTAARVSTISSVSGASVPTVQADATTEDASTSPSEPPPAPVESVAEGQAAPAAAAPGPPRPGGTMSVLATGYCLRGTTATGLPVAPGIVAVDPSVIPLGTRMTIPGYGEGVAADVGGRIKGARIDVWLASCSQAAAFTRAVTITFH